MSIKSCQKKLLKLKVNKKYEKYNVVVLIFKSPPNHVTRELIEIQNF